jgi:hypothetical protein
MSLIKPTDEIVPVITQYDDPHHERPGQYGAPRPTRWFFLNPCNKYSTVEWIMIMAGMLMGILLYRIARTPFYKPALYAVGMMSGNLLANDTVRAYSFTAGVAIGMFCYDGLIDIILHVCKLIRKLLVVKKHQRRAASEPRYVQYRDPATGAVYYVSQ